MSTDDNKTIALRFFQEVWGDGNLASVDELAAPNITVSYPYLGSPISGPDALKAALQDFHAQMPSRTVVSQDDIIAEDDKVVLCWTVSGTYAVVAEQQLGFQAIAGKEVTWTGISIFRILNGQVVEEKGLEDERAHIDQLGLNVVSSQPT